MNSHATTLFYHNTLARRLWAWAQERFPLHNALLFVILYAVALVFGRGLTHSGDICLGLRDVLGFFPVWCFFLMLRVFDEHKDYAIDCHNHPDRVLQRGLITLGHLKVVGAVAVLVQGIGSMAIDNAIAGGGAPGAWIGPVTQMWLLVMGWSILMAKEFFVGEWLAKRLVLYAFSHMLVMPLCLLWIAQMGAGAAALPNEVWVLAFLSFAGGAAFEITRKTKGPEEERDTIDSYSRVWGSTGAALVVAAFLVLAFVAQIWLVYDVLATAQHWAWYLPLVAALALPLTTLHRYRVSPSAKGREHNEAAVGLSMLLGYAVPIAALLMTRGVTWL